MLRAASCISILAVACAHSPESEVAEQPTVEIPEPKPEKTKREKAADDVPVPSNPHRGDAYAADPEPAEEEEAVPEANGSLPVPGPAGRYAGPTGGPECSALANCCLKSTAFGGAAADPRMCNHMRNLPSAICVQVLPQLRREAAKHGIHCGP